MKTFQNKYGNYKNTFEKLIKRIKWKTQAFTELSQLKLVYKDIALYLKTQTIDLIGKRLQNCFQSRGICSFNEMKSAVTIELPETISVEEYNQILKEEYIIFM